jgi:hypothetical protein
MSRTIPDHRSRPAASAGYGKAARRSAEWAAAAVIVLLFLLPYWLFDGQFFIGGDDSRLFYVYPELWMKNIAWSSWFHLSSTGQHNPQQFIIPILTVFSVAAKFLPPLVVLNMAFSSPLALGFIFFRKMLHALIGEEPASVDARWASVLGGMFFIMSPILWVITIAAFLYAAWLVALLPILLFCFIKYIRTDRLGYAVYGAISSAILALALFSVPWFLGAVMPVAAGLAVCALLSGRSEVTAALKKTLVFLGALISVQCFWLLPLVMSVLDGSGSFGRAAFSTETQDTFTPTVVGTMFHNNVLFPLLNLFHRSIVFDFNWMVKSAFITVYDNMLVLNLVFIAAVLWVLIAHPPSLRMTEKRILYALLVAFLTSLFLFTVNIGPLRHVFLLFREVPGFGMFRNAYDKFAPGFVLIYATLAGFSLWIILSGHMRERRWRKSGLVLVWVVVLFINALPIKGLVNKPLWTTKNIRTLAGIPKEYEEFLGRVRLRVPATDAVLTVPFAFPAYMVVRDHGSDNVYAGASPVKVLSGVDDYAGFLSFSSQEAQRFFQVVERRDLEEAARFLRDHNINYVLVARDIPQEVMQSYLFTAYPGQVEFQEKLFSWLLPNVLGERVATSTNGAYELYQAKNRTSLLESKGLTFKRIGLVKYRIRLSNASAPQLLEFRDSFGLGWRLYADRSSSLSECQDSAVLRPNGVRECAPDTRLFDWEDLSYLWKKPLPFVHTAGRDGVNNHWIIDPSRIASAGQGEGRLEGADDAAGLEMTLFFYPQLYFYIGLAGSVMALLALSLWACRRSRRPGRSAPSKGPVFPIF